MLRLRFIVSFVHQLVKVELSRIVEDPFTLRTLVSMLLFQHVGYHLISTLDIKSVALIVSAVVSVILYSAYYPFVIFRQSNQFFHFSCFVGRKCRDNDLLVDFLAVSLSGLGGHECGDNDLVVRICNPLLSV